MLEKDTISIQQQLATYCRTGETVSIEGANSDRLPHYRRLVYNVMYGLLEKAFPIMKSILTEAEFKSLVSAYLTDHNAQEPQVWKVPGEFYNFLKEFKHPLLEEHVYLIDLAMLEWSEIFLFNQEDKAFKDFVEGEISIGDRFVLNENSMILEFSYPVHKGNFEEISDKKGRCFLLGFRNNTSKKVHFLEISILHKELISQIDQQKTLTEAIDILSNAFNLKTEELEMALIPFLKKLKDQGFLLGKVSDQ